MPEQSTTQQQAAILLLLGQLAGIVTARYTDLVDAVQSLNASHQEIVRQSGAALVHAVELSSERR